MTNIGDFDLSLLNIDQIASKNNGSIIYEINSILIGGGGGGGKNSPSTQDGLPGLFTKQNLVFDIS